MRKLFNKNKLLWRKEMSERIISIKVKHTGEIGKIENGYKDFIVVTRCDVGRINCPWLPSFQKYIV